MQEFLGKESNELSQKTVCQNIVETISKVFGVDVVILLTINPQDQNRQYFATDKTAEIFGTDDELFPQIALDREDILVINDFCDCQWLEQDRATVTFYREKIRSLLAFPLTCQYGLKAYISLYSCYKVRTWQNEELRLVMMMAAQAGLAISQTYAYEEMKALAQREVTINRVTAVIRSSLEPYVIYNAIVTELGGTLKVEGCALSLWTKSDRYVRCVALYKSQENRTVSQKTQDWQRATVSLVPIAENPLLQKLLQVQKPVCLSDLQQEQNLARFDLPWRSQSRAILIVPLIFDGEIIGSITLREKNTLRYWRNWEIELAQAVASQAAIAVAQAKLYETTKKQAIELQVSENRVKQLNNYLTESILKRFLPEAIVNKAATGELVLDLSPEPHLITVLFGDLVGFTKLSSQLEVDVLSELLNDYLEAMTQAIFDNSGTIDKFVGDGVMALFGAPEELSAEQQAEYALATAQAMSRYLIPLNQKWQGKKVWQTKKIPDLKLRCGIHQGRAVVGMFGGKQRKDYTAIGKVVNIAARLQQTADPNSILLSETVFNGLKTIDKTKIELKLVQLKGIEPNFRSYSLSVDTELLSH
jgi:class 3 adenylate cyclase